MKIVVLMGGPSAEREISLATGRAVVEALRRMGHEVVPLDPSPGESVMGSAEAALKVGNTLPGYLRFLTLPEVMACDAVFIALHGEIGEDGRVQAALDLAGIPYTGSGALACALSMNKDMSKKIFLSQGIATPAWLLRSLQRDPSKRGATAGESGRGHRFALPSPAEISSIGGFPVVVKPNDQGSTIGLTIVEDENHMAGAFETAARYSHEILLEEYIPGRELTVSVLDGNALPVVEIIPEGGLYDYTRKYVKGKSRYVVPAELSPKVEAQVKELGMRCFDALACRGFGRVDVRLSPSDEVFCLEVNTIPGMTETSLVPMAAGAVGISFEMLVGRILALATLDGPHRKGEL